MEKVIIKDFMGNEINVGDNVVISDSTYSKTPYLVLGTVTEIGDPKLFKNGNLDYVIIFIDVIGRSCHYRSTLEMNNYEHQSGAKTRFRYSDKCYINILKIS
jgi:hypothetical protein